MIARAIKAAPLGALLAVLGIAPALANGGHPGSRTPASGPSPAPVFHDGLQSNGFTPTDMPAPAAAQTVAAQAGAAQTAAAGKPGWKQTGQASFYASRYNGRRTAMGTRYDPTAMTAAHPTLPLGTRLQVVNAATGRSVVVTVTDRQAHNGRVIDLSRQAAAQLGMLQSGTAQVQLIALATNGPLQIDDSLAPMTPPTLHEAPATHARHPARAVRATTHVTHVRVTPSKVTLISHHTRHASEKKIEHRL